MSCVDNASAWNILLEHKAKPTQETEVTITIKADEVQKGDKIAVTVKGKHADRERTTTYTGVAHNKEFEDWSTEAGYSLFTCTPEAVIELLDRPEPKLTIPTLPNAVVKYTFGMDELRFAVRDDYGNWKCYGEDGRWMNSRGSDEAFQEMLLEDSPEFEIVFGGIK